MSVFRYRENVQCCMCNKQFDCPEQYLVDVCSVCDRYFCSDCCGVGDEFVLKFMPPWEVCIFCCGYSEFVEKANIIKNEMNVALREFKARRKSLAEEWKAISLGENHVEQV